MIITKEKAIAILSFDPKEPRPNLLRIFKREYDGIWEFWADYGKDGYIDPIPLMTGMTEKVAMRILATTAFNTANGNALLETYRHNHTKE